MAEGVGGAPGPCAFGELRHSYQERHPHRGLPPAGVVHTPKWVESQRPLTISSRSVTSQVSSFRYAEFAASSRRYDGSMPIYWLEHEGGQRLGIVSRPRGGDWLEDEIVALRREGVDVLVSLLTRQEQTELGLEVEASACQNVGVTYLNFPIADRSVPESRAEFRSFLEQVQVALDSGKRIGAHCRAGIGRSSLLIAALLRSRGVSATEAFRLLSAARGLAVPDTPEQVAWVDGLG